MNKFSEYGKKRINAQDRLIFEQNMQQFASFLRGQLNSAFQGANVGRLGSDSLLEDDNGGMTAKFVYTDGQDNPNLHWQCQFSFSMNGGQYMCSQGSGTSVNGSATTGIQEAIKELVADAKAKIVDSQNESMKSGRF